MSTAQASRDGRVTEDEVRRFHGLGLVHALSVVPALSGDKHASVLEARKLNPDKHYYEFGLQQERYHTLVATCGKVTTLCWVQRSPRNISRDK